MNTFFSYQPELLYSINIILPPTFFGKSGVVVIGFVALLIAVVCLFLQEYKKIRISTNKIIVIILILWTPLFLRFFYNNTVELRQTLFLLGQSSQEKIRWRYCSIDLNQNFYGSFCRIPMFTNLVHSTVPRGSRITIAASPLSVFLEYQLSDSYIVNYDLNSSDYFILYQPQARFDFTSDGGLYTSSFNDDRVEENKTFLGNFETISQLNQGAVILRKISL
jgi:hypothetical protein